MEKVKSNFGHLRVASVEVVRAECHEVVSGNGVDGSGCVEIHCYFSCCCKDGSQLDLKGKSTSRALAIAVTLAEICIRPFTITHASDSEHASGGRQIVVAVADDDARLAGVGRFVATDKEAGFVIATLRALSHAGLLKPNFRANNQKVFRGWSQELVAELVETFGIPMPEGIKQLEAEGVVLEHVNRVASAAVLTAANHPKPDSILSLFDTSVWLFDVHGRRRDAYTDTDLWLAWYPGVQNDEHTVDQVIASMPAAPASKIPWIVRVFENPKSWVRFRGAVDLEDHDVMHVLLGRGLQDQDEAFVLGFAMGTAKSVSLLQYLIFKWVLARVYPEPYRIPKFLQPAFDLGVQCGQKTGLKNLYKSPLKELRGLSVRDARREAGIDIDIVLQHYEQEQRRIPFTIASLRLP